MPAGFHTYVFQVDAAGNAQWLADGVLVMTYSGLAAENDVALVIDSTNPKGAGPRFDNVRVNAGPAALPASATPSGTLLVDGFDGGLGNWAIFNGTWFTDSTTGAPAPSLAIGKGLLSTIKSGAAFDASRGLKISFRLCADFMTGMDGSGFSLHDQANGLAEWAQLDVNTGGREACLGPNGATFTHLGPPSSGYRQFTLEIQASGDAHWSVDDVPVVWRSGLPTAGARYELWFDGSASADGSGPRFDDVVVTVP
jgi:hypothetical protein